MKGETTTLARATWKGGARPPDALSNVHTANLPGGQVPPSSKGLFAAALAVAVLPKCLLCLAGYLAAGGAMVELCGSASNDHSAAWWIGGAAGGALLVVGPLFGCKKRRGLSAGPRR